MIVALLERDEILKKPGSKVSPAQRTPELTIDDVAAAAGVSTATISRFFNSPERLRATTAARVQEVVDRLGYVPNLLAGALSSARSKMVAAVIPTMSNSIFSSTIQAISDTLADQGYSVVLGLTGAADQYSESQLLSIIGRRPDGIILTGTVVSADIRTKLEASGIPTIETWDLPRDPIDMAVGFSHEAVGRAIGAHIVRTVRGGRNGRKRIFIVSAGGVRAVARRHGLTRVLMENGFPEPEMATFPGITSYGDGRRAVAAHLDAGGRPDVIVCSSDWGAHGAIDELRLRGIRVPNDVAVLGFGDIAFAAELDPPLTTVKIDGQVIGEEATRFLIKRARGEKVRRRVVDVGFELVVRSSG